MLINDEIKIAIKHAQEIAEIDVGKALVETLEIFNMVKDCDNPNVIGDTCKLIGNLYIRNNKMVDAKNYYLEAIKNYILCANFKEIGNCYNNLIITSFYSKEFHLIEEYKQQALKFYFKAKDNVGALSIANNVSVFYQKNKEYQRSYHSLKSVYDKYHHLLTEKEELMAKSNLLVNKLFIGDKEEVLNDLLEVAKIAEEKEYFLVLSSTNNSLAEFYESIEDYKSANLYLRKSFMYTRKAKNKDVKEQLSNHFSSIEANLTKSELSIIKKENQVLQQKHIDISKRNGFLESLLETIPLPLYHMNIEGYIQGCNKAFLDFLGVKFEDIYNKHFTNFYTKHEIDYTSILKKRLQNKEITQQIIETEVKGDKKVLDVYRDIYYNEVGEVSGLVTIFNDITQKRKLDNELLESKEKLEAIFNNAQVGILMMDTNLKVTYLNPYILDKMKYTAEEIYDKGVRIFKNDCKDFISKLRHQFKTKNISSIKSTDCLETKNGELIRVNLEVTKIFNAEKELTSYLFVIKDVSEEYLIKEQVEKLNAHLKSILESASQVYICSIDRDCNYTYFNENYKRNIKNHVGLELSVGDNYFIRYKDLSEKQDKKSTIAKVLAGESISGIREYPETKKVKLEILQYYYSPIIDSNNNVIGATVFSYDITDRVVAQRKLAHESSTKDKFFSIIAHDLRSPVGNIKAMLEHLTSEKRTPIKEIRSILPILTDSARNTFDLLENLLKWASNQRGYLSFIPEQVMIKAIIDNVIKVTENLATSKNIKLSVDVSSEAQAYIDIDMFKTIIRNLLTNAIKYTPKKGQIKLTAITDAHYCTIKVTDTGIGIKEEIIPYLTEFDKTVSTYGTEGEKGSGLGLVLCRELVERMHGKMWIESEIGKGSSFSFTVPTNMANY